MTIKDNQFQEKLGKELKENQSPKQLKYYKEEIEKLRAEVNDIINKKTVLLEFTIENQLLVYIYNYFTHLVTEKKIVNKETEEVTWKRVWNTFDEFLNADEILIGTANTYLTILMSEQID